MTVIEASNRLWTWFSKNDTFCIDNLAGAVLIIESVEADWATLLAALQEFEKLNIVIKTTINTTLGDKKDFWILRKSLATYEQTVGMTALTAQKLADVINFFGQTFGEDSFQADPTQIKEMDILRVTELCASLIKKETP